MYLFDQTEEPAAIHCLMGFVWQYDISCRYLRHDNAYHTMFLRLCCKVQSFLETKLFLALHTIGTLKHKNIKSDQIGGLARILDFGSVYKFQEYVCALKWPKVRHQTMRVVVLCFTIK